MAINHNALQTQQQVMDVRRKPDTLPEFMNTDRFIEAQCIHDTVVSEMIAKTKLMAKQ